MWERACSRKRSVSHRMYRLNHRIREQARSHMGLRRLIVPTLCVGMQPGTLRVLKRDAERHKRRSHAERGNDQRLKLFARPWA